ncbi:MAG TPA: FAD-dependent oxidoreductase, partial [bacterium]|nr:FAD-dependent oxidoreductase [bacterium]
GVRIMECRWRNPWFARCQGQTSRSWHLASFEAKTGQRWRPPALAGLETFQVKVENGKVFLRQSSVPKKSIRIDESRCFVVAGAGAAAVAAASQLRQEGYTGRIILVSEETDLPYDRPSLTKAYLLGQRLDEDILLRQAADYEADGMELLPGRSVVRVQRKEKKLILEGGQQLCYEKLLLATGARPRKLSAPGAELPGVFYLRRLAEARVIRQRLAEVRKAVVVGSGFLGLEVAATLREKGIEVHLVTPEVIPLVRILGREAGEYFLKLHRKNGVFFHPECRVSFSGKNRVEQVHLSNGEKIEADIVVAGVGVEIDLNYLEGTGLATAEGVIVDQRQKTADPDIFAAGDLARMLDPFDGCYRRMEHWAEAQRQGQEAARAMLGLSPGEPWVPFFWTRQYQVTFRYVGYGSKFDTVVTRGYPAAGEFLCGYFLQNRLVAVSGVGKTEDLVWLREILRRKLVVSQSQFASEDFDLKQFVGLKEEKP